MGDERVNGGMEDFDLSKLLGSMQVNSKDPLNDQSNLFDGEKLREIISQRPDPSNYSLGQLIFELMLNNKLEVYTFYLESQTLGGSSDLEVVKSSLEKRNEKLYLELNKYGKLR